MDSLVLPWANTETMSIFLAEFVRRHADEVVLMVMDRAAWHIAKQLTLPDKLRLIFLSPYSLEPNPA